MGAIVLKKQRIGVIGVGRGSMIFSYCKIAKNAELVAICDKWEDELYRTKRMLNDDKISYYTDYDEFLKFRNDMKSDD